MTEQLAKLYGTVSVNIHKNFSRNFERFTEGKHFYKVEGDELRELKNSLTDFQVVSPNTRSVILWTEKGAARHAKMLDTEKDNKHLRFYVIISLEINLALLHGGGQVHVILSHRLYSIVETDRPHQHSPLHLAF